MLIAVSDKNRQVDKPDKVSRILYEYFQQVDAIDCDKEHFFVIHLNARNKVKRAEVVSIGTVEASLVHPREVFTRAVSIRSSSIILAHNHPSGNYEPSEQDQKITEKLVSAGHILNIEVLDHVIYTKQGYYSFKEHDKM